MPEFTGQRDLRGYAQAFWRWKYLFLACLIAVPLAAFLLERGKPNVYGASALVGVNQATVNTSSSGGGSFSTSNVTAIAQLVTTSPVASVAADLLHPPASAGQIASEVTATGDSTTDFLTISAQDRSAVRAAQVANAFAHAIGINLQQSALANVNSAIRGVQAQLAHLGPKDSARGPLIQQLNQLRASRATQGSQAAILQPATPNFTPVGPHVRRTVELGIIIGLLLGLGAIVLAESADRRVRSPEDLEAATDLALLAAIAPSAFTGDVKGDSVDDEAFQMLRTALMYYNVDRQLKSVVITSAAEKEGKTTVAGRLAIAAAKAGQTVVLVDADLRRAEVGGRFHIERVYGLGAVLVGERALSQVLVPYPIQEPGSGKLLVLPAGLPPPNPSALVSSAEMQRVLRELEDQADLVIVDTPAALAVSDAVPLMRSVSGVVLIARMGVSTRQTIGRVKTMVESARGNLLGVVATGAPRSPAYGGYAAYQPVTTTGRNGRMRLKRRAKESDPTLTAEPEAAAHER